MSTVFQPFFNTRIDSNEWLREVVNFQFDKKYGSMYWLAEEKRLGINAKTDIKTTDDLRIFGNRTSDFLRTTNVEFFIPQYYLSQKGDLKVYETGGTLGNPSRVALVDYWKLQAEWLSYFFDLHKIPRGENILWIGPTGGRTTLDYFRNLALLRNGVCYFVELDSRWIKNLIRNGDIKGYDAYLAHIKRQVLSVMETQRIGIVLSTPKLLELLYHDVLVKFKTNLTGIFYGGTSMSVEMHEIFLTDFYKGIPQVANYGNTLMGVALSPARTGTSVYDLNYYPYMPYFYIEVVGFSQPDTPVRYGEAGQVKFTTLHKEIFLPNVLERDEAVRLKPCELFAWDGVSNVMPLSKNKTSKSAQVIEGVY